MRELPPSPFGRLLAFCAVTFLLPISLQATPANRAGLEKHYDRFLAKAHARCTTCHLPSDKAAPESLAEFPHNPFGDRLRQLGETNRTDGRKLDLAARLARAASEDNDQDGIPNEIELLLGHNPGDARDTPTSSEMAQAPARVADFSKFLAGYRWQPFQPVQRPPVPADLPDTASVRNPLDAFLVTEWAARGLRPQAEAPRELLLRRVYQDLIGLNPTPEEQETFLNDTTSEAYERVVDRLLEDPRHGERWARHWMDVWRYSDWAGWTDGGQVRDSKPHIWRWRDWIVESLNSDKPYDRMLLEMLAADELAPEDPEALRATGFLVRNYKMLSREQWLEDTVKHTAQAFLGVTVGCAKCHDHMVDPISQRDYYALRAIFEPHQVRTDRVPGEVDVAKDGLPRVFDAAVAPTYLFVRGDERHPLTNEVIQPGVAAALGGKLDIQELTLPWLAANPDQRDFVVRDLIVASERAVVQAKAAWVQTRSQTNVTSARLYEAALAMDVAEKKLAALEAVLAAESAAHPTKESQGLQLAGVTNTVPATNAVRLQRLVTAAEAQLRQQQAHSALATAPTNKRADARKKLAEAEKQLSDAAEALDRALNAGFKPRPAEHYPATSSGRRRAFARWLANPQNPLTARVAANQVWLRHFGAGLVTTPADFGRNGRPPTHPQLLDWLAAEFMQPSTSAARPWSFRHLHRLIVTSAAYRRSSTPDPGNLAADPDNRWWWRMNARRLEAEAVRDNLLYASGALDLTRGGPELDQNLALTSPRRSLYLRHAAEKQAEFLQVFDGPSVTECYERRSSVMPQQALALGNSELAVRQARAAAAKIEKDAAGDERRFIHQAFRRFLGRTPTEAEAHECLEFLSAPLPASTRAGASDFRKAENLILVLLNHSDFVTIR